MKVPGQATLESFLGSLGRIDAIIIITGITGICMLFSYMSFLGQDAKTKFNVGEHDFQQKTCHKCTKGAQEGITKMPYQSQMYSLKVHFILKKSDFQLSMTKCFCLLNDSMSDLTTFWQDYVNAVYPSLSLPLISMFLPLLNGPGVT